MGKQKPKIGAGHAKAMGRMGLSELRQAFYPGSNVAQQHAEHGIWGTKTPQEVVGDKQAGLIEQHALAQLEDKEGSTDDSPKVQPEDKSILDEHLRQAEASEGHAGQDRAMERD